MKHSVGIRSLAISFPNVIRTNNYWKEKFPNRFMQVKTRQKQRMNSMPSPHCNTGIDIWSQEVSPYLADPFRGSVERRVCQGESSLMLEEQAARDALDAANLSPHDIDLLIVSSLFSERVAVGNAAYLARQLALECPAWNIESTCSSALIALQNAWALMQTGTYHHVLIVASHLGSYAVDETDTLSWSMGDGAGAFVVSFLNPDQGILSTKVIHTFSTCDAYSHELVIDPQGQPKIHTQTGSNATALVETAVEHVRNCCIEVVTTAGFTLDQIDCFVFNTPTAWYASVCTRALAINPQRTLNLYPRYANIGPVFPIANLYHAAFDGKIRENDLVLVYTNGAAATAVATVMRWGNVKLGKPPASPLSDSAKDETIHLSIKRSFPREQHSNVEQYSFSKEQLFAAPIEHRQSMLECYLLEWLTNALRTSSTLDPQQPLALVLDSLMALELRRKIEIDMQVLVPMEQFFGEVTLTQLAEFVLQQLAVAELVTTQSMSDTYRNHKEEREHLSL